MTKRNLLLVGLFLVFGLATMASSALASTQWVTGFNPNYNGRDEGLAEETGEYTLTNNVAGTTSSGNYFTFTYSQPVIPGSAFLKCAGTDFPSGCGGLFTVTSGTPTAYNVIVKFISTFYFTVTGDIIELVVRVDAAAPGVVCITSTNGGWPNSGPGVVTAYVVASQVTPLSTGISVTGTIPNNTYPVLYANCTPALSLTFGTEHGKEERHAAYVLTCLGVKEIGEYDNDFTLNVDEEFANALTSFSYEYASDPDATNGTTFTIVFTNVPTQVTLDEVDIKPCATLWTGNPLYCPGGTMNVVLDPSTPHKGGNVTPSGPGEDTVTFTFDVTNEDAGSPETVDIKFVFWSHGPLPPGLPQMVANVYKGPTTPSTDIPRFTGILEGTGGTPWNLSVVEFTDCLTSLLWPYVTDIAGFNTGLAISNTTLDPFNTPSPADSPSGPNPLDLMPYYGKGSATVYNPYPTLVPQQGPCQVYLFANGTVPWAATMATPVIVPGSTYAFDMGGFFGVTATGYAIAVCEFQNADGYAFIYYNLGLDSGLAGNYLALVIPSPNWYHRTPAGDFLGEFAIAPLSIDRHLAWKNFGGH